MDELKINKFRGLSERFAERKRRAEHHLKTLEGREECCFALCGLHFEDAPFEFDKVACLRRVEFPPSEIELAGCLSDKTLMSAVGRHTPAIRHELAVYGANASVDRQSLYNVGWWIISALRCKSGVDLLVPAVAHISWDAMAGAATDSCHVQLLEDVPAARRFAAPSPLRVDDLSWVKIHLPVWVDLLERPAFRLAVDSLTTHHMHANLRMSAAALWAGVEALFAINSELRFRLASFTAAYLEPRGSGRLELYREIKQLYDYRSKAVHGASTSDVLLKAHILKVRHILSRLLCKMTEAGAHPSPTDFEDALFG